MTKPTVLKYAASQCGSKKLKEIKIVFFDFDGVFTNNYVYVTETGIESARCSRLDGIGLKLLQNLGIVAHIISSEPNPIVAHRAQKLQIACDYNVICKVEKAKKVLTSHGLTFAESAFVGNDVNDIPLIEKVKLSIAVADAWPEVFKHVDAVTSRVGGDGAVREVCEIISQEKANDRS